MAFYHWQLLLCFWLFPWRATFMKKLDLCVTCKCTPLKKGLKINCSARLDTNLNITSFPEDTVWIDLSKNNIEEIKWRFPRKIRYINLSRNKISSLSRQPFQDLSFLKCLNLEQNYIMLNESNYYPSLFMHLQRLHILNIKNNSKTHGGVFHIDKTFSRLVTLKTLKMDLPFNFTFGNRFKLLKNLSRLDVSGITGHCDLRTISGNFFENIPFLNEIDISNCMISHVDKGPFKFLRQLTKLDISYNRELGFASLPNITFGLNETYITTFHADSIHCHIGKGTQLMYSHIQYLRQTKLSQASFASNRMELIEKGVLSSMPTTLKKLSFAANRLTTGIYLFEFHTLHNLREYNMTLLLHDEKNFAYFPEKCNEKSDPFTSNRSLTSFDQDVRNTQFKGNHIYNITIYLPSKLETLYANCSKLYGRFPKLNFNSSSLKNIYIQDNFLFAWKQPVFGLERLERLDISNNLCSEFSPLTSASLVGLKYLNLARNMLGRSIQSDKGCQIFHNQRNVEELDISSNQLENIPSCTFKNMVKMKMLRLNHNQITELSFRIRHMIKLSYVDLSDNRLTTLSDETMKSLNLIFEKSKVLINLQNNTFQCTCQNIAFLAWMNEHRNHFRSIEMYRCSSRNNQFDFREMDKSLRKLYIYCIDFDILNVTACILITLIICLVLMLIIRKYIWHIRYFIHKNKRKSRSETRLRRIEKESHAPLLTNIDMQNSNIQDLSIDSLQIVCDRNLSVKQYLYDAFISYAGANREFVFQKMKPLLEAHSIKLCVRDIHFEIGNGKIENIMKSIGRSRRTICIVSKAYMKSRWRTYELNMAKLEGIKSRGSLGYVHLILMPDLFHGACNTNIKDLIEKKNYLDYPPEDSGLQEDFWKNLIDVIKSEYL